MNWTNRHDHLTAPLPHGAFRFIALDVETANSDASSICQIGIACVRHDGSIDTYATYVNPRCHFSGFNTQLHGIGASHVTTAPDFATAFARLCPLLGPHPLIQHSSFDKRAIDQACAAATLPAPPWQWSNSVTIARRAWPEFIGNGGHGLSHLKRQLNLNFDHHDAGEDARAAALVVLHAEARLGRPYTEILSAKAA